MSTFENGWICRSCWMANRDQDVRCYRCKALHPEYREVTDPPPARHAPSLRPFARAVRTSASRPILAVVAACRGVVHSARRGVLAAGRGVVVAGRSVVHGARSLTAAVVQFVRGTLGAGWAVGRSVVRLVGATAVAVAMAVRSAGRAAAAAIRAGAMAVATAPRRGARAVSRAVTPIGRLVSGAALQLGGLVRQPGRLLRGSAARSHPTR